MTAPRAVCIVVITSSHCVRVRREPAMRSMGWHFTHVRVNVVSALASSPAWSAGFCGSCANPASERTNNPRAKPSTIVCERRPGRVSVEVMACGRPSGKVYDIRPMNEPSARRSVYLCDAARTPFGRYGGVLSGIRTDDLAALPIAALRDRHPGVDWARLDDVVYGCANQAGEDNRNVG